jgi:putative transposase
MATSQRRSTPGWAASPLRSRKCVKAGSTPEALAEMYVQGVSTRKVKAVTEKLCGVAMSSTHVSHAATLQDTELEKWRNRPLGEYLYLFVDAYYEQVREDGQVRHLAVLSAVGVVFCSV